MADTARHRGFTVGHCLWMRHCLSLTLVTHTSASHWSQHLSLKHCNTPAGQNLKPTGFKAGSGGESIGPWDETTHRGLGHCSLRGLDSALQPFPRLLGRLDPPVPGIKLSGRRGRSRRFSAAGDSAADLDRLSKRRDRGGWGEEDRDRSRGI